MGNKILSYPERQELGWSALFRTLTAKLRKEMEDNYVREGIRVQARIHTTAGDL